MLTCISLDILNLFLFSDRMAENVKKELNVKESEITSTVVETCFVNIPEDEIKLENTHGKFTLSCRIKGNCV